MYQCPDRKNVASDKLVKKENDGKSTEKQVKFQVSKCAAVKQEGASDDTERMMATLNGKTTIFFSVDTMASKSVWTLQWVKIPTKKLAKLSCVV